jgi:hypothetical protein
MAKGGVNRMIGFGGREWGFSAVPLTPVSAGTTGMPLRENAAPCVIILSLLAGS